MALENVLHDGEEILGEQVNSLVTQRTKMRISELLNPTGADDWVQDVTEEAMVDNLASGDREDVKSDNAVVLPALNGHRRTTEL